MFLSCFSCGFSGQNFVRRWNSWGRRIFLANIFSFGDFKDNSFSEKTVSELVKLVLNLVKQKQVLNRN